MTRKDDRNLQIERRLRHATWEREPMLPAWCWFVGAMFVAAFIVPMLMRTA